MSYEIRKDNFSCLWFIYKDTVNGSSSTKVSICIEKMLSHLQGKKTIERIRKPCIVIKQGHYRSADFFEYAKGPFTGRGSYKTCHRLEGQKRVQLKTELKTLTEKDLIEREVRDQRKFAAVSSLCCPILFAYMKPSRKKSFLRCVVLIEKGFEKSLDAFFLSPLELHFAFIKIAIAIRTAHYNGFIFSDLKEENILYSKNGELAISDLGGGFYEGDTPPGIHTYSHSSPESFLGRYDKKHDIFSFFMIIYRKTIRYDSPEERIHSLKKTLTREEFVKAYVQEILKFRRSIPKINPYFSLLQDMSRPNVLIRPNIDSVLSRLYRLTPLIRTIQSRTETGSKKHSQPLQKR